MSLRTRISPLPHPSRPSPRSRIPIERIPQPRENRMASTWRLAKPRRLRQRCRLPKPATLAAGLSPVRVGT
jgi:hypothetical protein